MKYAKLVEDAKRDPAKIYPNPSDVLRDRRLSDGDRLEILESWERDARALSVAADEAMQGGEPNRLQEVIEARKLAEKRAGTEHEAHEASKYGGDETGAEDA
jgi:hypothetical protein